MPETVNKKENNILKKIEQLIKQSQKQVKVSNDYLLNLKRKLEKEKEKNAKVQVKLSRKIIKQIEKLDKILNE